MKQDDITFCNIAKVISVCLSLFPYFNLKKSD